MLELALSLSCAEIRITDASSAAFQAFHRVTLKTGEVAQAIRRFQQPILELLLHVKAYIVLINAAELLIMSPMRQDVFPDDRSLLLLHLVHHHLRWSHFFRESWRRNCGNLFLLLLDDFLICIDDFSEA